MAGANLHTYTGWGSVPYWSAFVANSETQGYGRFYDPRLNDTNTFPVAARLGFANVPGPMDLITGKLPALQFYQLSLTAPTPPQNSFDQMKSRKGGSSRPPFFSRSVFENCSRRREEADAGVKNTENLLLLTSAATGGMNSQTSPKREIPESL